MFQARSSHLKLLHLRSLRVTFEQPKVLHMLSVYNQSVWSGTSALPQPVPLMWRSICTLFRERERKREKDRENRFDEYALPFFLFKCSVLLVCNLGVLFLQILLLSVVSSILRIVNTFKHCSTVYLLNVSLHVMRSSCILYGTCFKLSILKCTMKTSPIIPYFGDSRQEGTYCLFVFAKLWGEIFFQFYKKTASAYNVFLWWTEKQKFAVEAICKCLQ